jgi:DNA-binding NarL/FixJ family response regulator
VDALPTIRHATTTDDARIAYYTLGSGPALVLLFPYHINHLVLNWDVPLHRRGMKLLAERFTVVNLDLRGAGRSDTGPMQLDRMSLDVREVMDGLGLRRFAVFAMGDAALIAAHLAVATPDRVSGIAMIEAGDSEENRRVFALRRLNRNLGADVRAGLITGMADPLNAAALARLMKNAASAESFDAYERVINDSSLEPLLSETQTPVLFVHAEGDEMLPADIARQLADLTAQATVLLVPGTSGMDVWRHDGVIDTISRYLLGDRAAPEAFSPPSISLAHTALTPREQEVLRLIARGRTNQQIADELFISLNTVSHHLRGVFAKTGSANRTEAAAFALRNGLT